MTAVSKLALDIGSPGPSPSHPQRTKLSASAVGSPSSPKAADLLANTSAVAGRTSQPNVLARLQALFPSSASVPSSPGGAYQVNVPDRSTTRPTPRFLKVKIITWNMHDSLPKGNLEDLLGLVPPYTPPPSNQEEGIRIPDLKADAGHPYHLIVVAGQECPSVSGIPMGLGAGFKLKDKDKDKDKATKENHENTPPKPRHKEKFREKMEENDMIPILQLEPETPVDPTDNLENPPVTADNAHHAINSGWSGVLENWFCRGGHDNLSDLHLKTPLSIKSVVHPKDYFTSRPLLSPRPSSRQLNEMSSTTPSAPGPYEMLIKERLMGIYLVVFVHRDVKPLVRGTSKSAVTAGLIGGRVGNKGGVGISVNLDGTTLLFMNAHLAAHEGKMHHRLANLAKIKAELQVDDFLGKNDPRVMAEDLTDRFDYTFVFGDLNFRLNVTRLHADWLISRREYAQALAFDQLRDVMQKGKAFVGFHEATVNFPPTFKYDVPRTPKGNKTPRGEIQATRSTNHVQDLTEIGEKHSTDEGSENSSHDERDNDAVDSVSFASSMWTRRSTSVYSHRTMDEEEAEGNEDSAPTFILPKSPKILDKVFLAHAAQKAKYKWLKLISSPSLPNTPSPTPYADRRFSTLDVNIPSTPRPYQSALQLTPRPQTPASKGVRSSLRRSRSKRSSAVVSTMSGATSPDEGDNDHDDKYDSSSKQRVPSWCDRILWKSTAKGDTDEETQAQTHEQHTSSHIKRRPSVVQFFNHAVRPRKSRGSRSQLLHSSSPGAGPETPPLSATSGNDGLKRISSLNFQGSTLIPETNSDSDSEHRHRQRHRRRGRKLYHSMSIDSVPVKTFLSSWHSPSNVDRQTPNRGRSFTTTLVPTSAPVPISVSDADHHTNSDNLHLSHWGTVRTALTTTPHLVYNHDYNGHDTPTPTKSTPPVRWRLLPFLSRDTDASPSTPSSESTGIHPVMPAPRKGDVVPLSYTALDNQAMRRLEGRSDHRPVIGSYAIYI